eukprot:PITA_13906
MNEMLMEREKNMLIGARLGQEFWVEAVETTCYLINRPPSSASEDKTPQELWNGNKPSLSHLRVKDVIKHEVQTKESEKIEFEIKVKESDSTTKQESEHEHPQTPVVKRSIGERRQLERYSPSSFCSNFAFDPKTMKEEVDSKDGKLWKEAMVDEMASLHKNEACDLVEFSDGRKPISRKWVFKKKTNAEGKVEK